MRVESFLTILNTQVLFCLLFFSMSISSCKGKNKVQKPEASYNNVYEAEPSILNIPIHIPAEELERKINQQFTGLIYEDNNMEDDNVMVKAWKKEDIAINLEGTTMSYSVPLRLWIKAGLKVEKFGISLPAVSKEVEGEITLHFTTTMSIQENWEMNTKTQSQGYNWMVTPKVNLGFMDLPITFIADRLVASNQEYISSEIDHQIKGQFNLKEYMQDFWENIQDPILVSEEYNLWMTLLPSKIQMTPFENRNDTIFSTVGIEAMSEVVMGVKPKMEKQEELPPFEMHFHIDDQFSVNIVADIPYSEAEQMVNESMVGETFASGKRAITVKKIELYGQDDQLVINTTVEGDFNGSMYLIGTPIYDPETSTIEITDIDFELETRNFLHKTAAWLFKSKFKRTLAPYLKFPLQENIDLMKEQVQESLNDNEIFFGVTVNGTLDDINIEEVFLDPEGMKLIIVSKGKMKVDIGGLN